jgi:hypothetical protein
MQHFVFDVATRRPVGKHAAMEIAYVSALSALAGSVVGGLASGLTS